MEKYEKSFLGDLLECAKYIGTGFVATAALTGCAAQLASKEELDGLVKKLVEGKGNYGTYDQAVPFVSDEADYNKDGNITKKELKRFIKENPWIEEEYQRALEQELNKKVEEANELTDEVEGLNQGKINETTITKKIIESVDLSKLPSFMVKAYQGKLQKNSEWAYATEIEIEFEACFGYGKTPYRASQFNIEEIKDYLGLRAAGMHLICSEAYDVLNPDISEKTSEMIEKYETALSDLGPDHELTKALKSSLDHKRNLCGLVEAMAKNAAITVHILDQNSALNTPSNILLYTILNRRLKQTKQTLLDGFEKDRENMQNVIKAIDNLPQEKQQNSPRPPKRMRRIRAPITIGYQQMKQNYPRPQRRMTRGARPLIVG